MKFAFFLTLAIVALCDPLPHKYMALRGYNINGHTIKETGITNVCIVRGL